MDGRLNNTDNHYVYYINSFVHLTHAKLDEQRYMRTSTQNKKGYKGKPL